MGNRGVVVNENVEIEVGKNVLTKSENTHKYIIQKEMVNFFSRVEKRRGELLGSSFY